KVGPGAQSRRGHCTRSQRARNVVRGRLATVWTTPVRSARTYTRDRNSKHLGGRQTGYTLLTANPCTARSLRGQTRRSWQKPRRRATRPERSCGLSAYSPRLSRSRLYRDSRLGGGKRVRFSARNALRQCCRACFLRQVVLLIPKCAKKD